LGKLLRIDRVPETDFNDCTTAMIEKEVSMKLCEKPWEHDGVIIREICKLIGGRWGRRQPI
jgi:hypothetical protein